jgi:hypothetical protein
MQEDFNRALLQQQSEKMQLLRVLKPQPRAATALQRLDTASSVSSEDFFSLTVDIL